MTDWLLVAGDFTAHGGMDMANFALASYLARPAGRTSASRVVHVVSHRVAPTLASMPAVRVHEVTRPFGSERFGEPLLRLTARQWQKRLHGSDLRVVANGGNVDAGDVNWVHYVHAAYTPHAAGAWNSLRVATNHRRYVSQERQAFGRARVVICNSRRTVADVVSAGVPKERARIVYYGIDPIRFGPVDGAQREQARQALGLPSDRPLALFVGALSDRRKGFDTLFEAWRTLCQRRDWDVDLAVAGTGAELPVWRERTRQQLPDGRIRFLGFRQDMPLVLAACDLLIHPARYEAYGLAVHEALCRGVAALVSAQAGVAERYPTDLASLLIADPESPSELVERLLSWRGDRGIAARVASFASELRARSWDHMAREIVATAEDHRT
jgi:glycosyltransferase involved in cell wall biosynthesis